MIIVDSMLGKLSRYLRMIGYEVEYITNEKDDSYILSRCKGNLVLTRDKLLRQKVLDSILVNSHEPLAQLKQILPNLPKPEHNFLDLCTVCGNILNRARKSGELPDYVSNDTTEIFYCEACKKYYWNGSHTKNFAKMMESIGLEIQQ